MRIRQQLLFVVAFIATFFGFQNLHASGGGGRPPAHPNIEIHGLPHNSRFNSLDLVTFKVYTDDPTTDSRIASLKYSSYRSEILAESFSAEYKTYTTNYSGERFIENSNGNIVWVPLHLRVQTNFIKQSEWRIKRIPANMTAEEYLDGLFGDIGFSVSNSQKYLKIFGDRIYLLDPENIEASTWENRYKNRLFSSNRNRGRSRNIFRKDREISSYGYLALKNKLTREVGKSYLALNDKLKQAYGSNKKEVAPPTY